MDGEERTLEGRRSVALTDQSLNAQHVDARAAQDHERKEQRSLPFRHEARRPAPRCDLPVSVRHGDAFADVGVAPYFVGMRVMRAVLGDPPAEAHADQHVPHREPEESVQLPGAEDLMMAGVVSDESQLGERQAQEAGNEEGPPGAPDQDQCGESQREGGDGDGDHDAVITEPAVEQAGFADLFRQDAKIGWSGFDSGRLHPLPRIRFGVLRGQRRHLVSCRRSQSVIGL